jgi:hypothetical protein
MIMRVLIACEFSGRVRDAFTARGHDAWSCDLLPSETPGQHIQADHDLHLFDIVESGKWDLLIAHPPCTYLCNSGVLRLYHGKTRNVERWELMRRAADFFKALLSSPVPKIAVENPVMHGHAVRLIGEKHSQTVQPYQFGHAESKRTCFWLRNLPLLRPTNVLSKPARGYWDNQTPSGQNRLSPGPRRAADRARTYAGIAAAMAEQWGGGPRARVIW